MNIPNGADYGADVERMFRDLDRLIEDQNLCKVVPSAILQDASQAQQNKGSKASSFTPGQCADSPLLTNVQKIAGAAGWDGGQQPANTPSAPTDTPIRKSRRVVSRIDRIAGKSWRALSPVEKTVAAAWHVASAGGHAVTLNLGIGREASLMNNADPRRLFGKQLNKRLNEAGLKGLPYALSFEVTPEAEGARLHVHGSIDTSGLQADDFDRLKDALCKAASIANGSLGGQRQVKLKRLYDPEGWADYIMKAERRTKRELGVDNVWLMSRPMSQLARRRFGEIARGFAA